MKAILWEQENDWECEGKILGCESCYKIINKGYLIGFESLNEAREMWGTFDPPKDNKAVCCHPDNWLICEDCFNDRFEFRRKTKKPFKVLLRRNVARVQSKER